MISTGTVAGCQRDCLDRLLTKNEFMFANSNKPKRESFQTGTAIVSLPWLMRELDELIFPSASDINLSLVSWLPMRVGAAGAGIESTTTPEWSANYRFTNLAIRAASISITRSQHNYTYQLEVKANSLSKIFFRSGMVSRFILSSILKCITCSKKSHKLKVVHWNK